MLSQGGGVHVNQATVTFINIQIHNNGAHDVRLIETKTLPRTVFHRPAAGNFLELTFDLPWLAASEIAARFELLSEPSFNAPLRVVSLLPLRVVSWN
jgi:hypothetical protein